MKLLQLLEFTAHGLPGYGADDELGWDGETYREAAQHLLFAAPFLTIPQPPLTPETNAFLANPRLTGDDFSYVGRGANCLVYGNDSMVVKIATPGSDGETSPIAPADLPPAIAAKVLQSGTCNGIQFTLCERLKTQEVYPLAEMLPLLFRTYDEGMVYTDPKAANMGRDANGTLKFTDLEHFVPLDFKKGNFESSLDELIGSSYRPTWPLLTSDAKNTYLLFDPESVKTPALKALQKKLFASLDAVGIAKDSSTITMTDYPPVLRIKQTQLLYGQPAQKEPLIDYLARSLNVSARAQSAEEIFMLALCDYLPKFGERGAQEAADLPPSFLLKTMNRASFQKFYNNLMSR